MEHTFKPLVENPDNDNPGSHLVENYSVPVEKSEPITTVGLNFTNICDHSNEVVDQSSMIPNVDENTVEEAKSPTTSLNFGSLVTDSKIPEQKFAVQSISVDEDRSMLPDPDISSSIMESINAHLNKQASNKPDYVPRKTNNWLTRLIDQRGEEYLTQGKLSVDEVSKNSERIIDDIIAGRIDYTIHGKYIIMPAIIETLIGVCSNKLALNKAIQYSLGYIYNDYTNRYNIDPNDTDRINMLNYISDNMSRNISQAISIVNQDICLYETLYNRLKYVQATKNATSLFNIPSELNFARKQAKKRY